MYSVVNATHTPGVIKQEVPARRERWLRWTRWAYSPLTLCLLVAIAVRIFLAIHTNPVIEGDEAVTGIQAENILRGQHPIYYYGQAYMGSLEAYIIALFFAIAGSSVFVLRVAMTATSLVLVWLTWSFGNALADEAHLTVQARRLFVGLATLVSALPPLYDVVVELRSLGGYVEAMIIMLWLLWSALRLTQSLKRYASSREIIWRWSGIGFLLGLGIWVDPLIIYAVSAAFLWLAGCFIFFFIYVGVNDVKLRRMVIKALYLSFVIIPSAVVGMVPAIDYGLHHRWTNFIYIIHSGSAPQGSRLQTIKKVGQLYARCIAPRVIGGTLPTESFVHANHPAVLTPGLIINMVCIGFALVAILLAFTWHQEIVGQIRNLTLLPMIFIVCTSVIYCTASISTASLYAGCGTWDLTGRYAAPLVIVLPFFLAAIVTALWFWHKKSSPSVPRSDGSSEPSLSRLNWGTIIPRLLLILVVLIYFGTQFAAYVHSSQRNTFQTSGCIPAPADDTAIIAYMRQIHMQYALATEWIGDPLTFKTNASILVTEPRSRVLSNSARVLASHDYGLILFAKHTDSDPLILQTLDKYHYRYQYHRFQTTTQWDVMVISTFNHPVSPTSKTFKTVLHPLYNQCTTQA
jgi:hypothetical protein